MIAQAFTILLIVLIAAIPIILWGYIFSYLDEQSLSHKKFVIGVVWGAVAVIPIIFLEKIIAIKWLQILDIFTAISSIGAMKDVLYFYLSLSLFTLVIAWLAFVCVSWSIRNKKVLKSYLKNMWLFMWITAIIAIFVWIFTLSWIGTAKIAESQSFGSALFDTTMLISFYYLLVAFIEETSKHFNFLQSTTKKNITLEWGVMYAIFIALGFAFIENILYFYNIYMSGWFNSELATTFFYRSVFAVMVHVTCSVVVASAYTKHFLQDVIQSSSQAKYAWFIIWLFLWIGLHLIFDLSLTFGLSFMIILYFLWGYFYISSIFYKE